MTTAIGLISLLLISLGLIQFLVAFALAPKGQRIASNRGRVAAILDLTGDRPSDGIVVWGLIACLNEELVITETVTAFLAQSKDARLVIVDDGSDDATAAA